MLFLRNSCEIYIVSRMRSEWCELGGQRVKIKDGAEQYDEREKDDDGAYYLINNNDAVGVEDAPYLVDEPRQTVPPKQGTEWNAQETEEHLDGVVGDDERELCEQSDEEKDDEGVGEGNEEGRHTVMDERILLLAADVHVLRGVASPAIDAEEKQQDAADNLQEKLRVVVVDHVHHERHAQQRYKGVDDVAHGGSDACHKPVPPTFVQCTLYAQYTNGSHWCTGYDAYQDALENKVNDVYVKCKWHKWVQRYTFSFKETTKNAIIPHFLQKSRLDGSVERSSLY